MKSNQKLIEDCKTNGIKMAPIGGIEQTYYSDAQVNVFMDLAREDERNKLKSSQPSEVVLPNADNVNNLINHLGERLRKQRDILKNTQEVLSNIHQVLTGWHSDGTSWTEWDETTRKSVYDLQNEIEKHLSFIHKDEIQQSPPPTKEIGETLSKEKVSIIIHDSFKRITRNPNDSEHDEAVKEAAEQICSLAIPKGEDAVEFSDEEIYNEINNIFSENSARDRDFAIAGGKRIRDLIIKNIKQ